MIWYLWVLTRVITKAYTHSRFGSTATKKMQPLLGHKFTTAIFSQEKVSKMVYLDKIKKSSNKQVLPGVTDSIIDKRRPGTETSQVFADFVTF